MGLYQQRLEEAAQQFKEYTKEHRITVLDEGAGMRRLVVQKPGTWAYGYTVTTWPNYLAITGDLGNYVFTRLADMFEFFRSPDGKINPGYWEEKLCAQDKNGTAEFDLDLLREGLKEDLGQLDEDERPGNIYEKMLDRLDDFNNHASEEESVVEAMRAFEDDAHERRRGLPTHQFLGCLHAIVLAIQLYDERKRQPTPIVGEVRLA